MNKSNRTKNKISKCDELIPFEYVISGLSELHSKLSGFGISVFTGSIQIVEYKEINEHEKKSFMLDGSISVELKRCQDVFDKRFPMFKNIIIISNKLCEDKISIVEVEHLMKITYEALRMVKNDIERENRLWIMKILKNGFLVTNF